jgi:hypothetical protein
MESGTIPVVGISRGEVLGMGSWSKMTILWQEVLRNRMMLLPSSKLKFPLPEYLLRIVLYEGANVDVK